MCSHSKSSSLAEHSLVKSCLNIVFLKVFVNQIFITMWYFYLPLSKYKILSHPFLKIRLLINKLWLDVLFMLLNSEVWLFKVWLCYWLSAVFRIISVTLLPRHSSLGLGLSLIINVIITEISINSFSKYIFLFQF